MENNQGPSRKVNELDNRGSHFYLALYWAEALKNQDKDISLKTLFATVHQALDENKEIILNELLAAQGHKVDVGGYYMPEEQLVAEQMRPSKTFNDILKRIN